MAVKTIEFEYDDQGRVTKKVITTTKKPREVRLISPPGPAPAAPSRDLPDFD